VTATAIAAPAFGQATPYTSHRKLTSTNGYAPMVFDLEQRRVTSFREHMYRFPSPGVETKELAFDLYLGLDAGGTSAWLTETALESAGYEVGTNLIRTVQERSGVRVTTTYAAPWGLDARAMLVVAEVEATGAAVPGAALFSLHNFHLGGGADGTDAEQITWDSNLGAYLESSSAGDSAQGVLVAKPLTAASKHTATPSNPYPLVNQGQRFADIDDSGVTGDAVSGFQWDLPTLEPNQPVWVALVVGYAPDADAAALVRAIDQYHGGRTPEAILAEERRHWHDWTQSGMQPNTQDADESQVSLQSLAILRMGQVREPGNPNGQLLASLPPGKWDVAWLRDGMLAVRALTATGHHDEAEAALDFYIRGPFGEYMSYVGRDYGLTVARHYGNAREESDWNANGPNIEFDGFGMYLEAAAEHVAHRPAWLTANRAHVDSLIADVLVDVRDMETGLTAADSSIWESHWDNGGRQRWLYTSGFAVRGLAAWADALDAAGHATAAARYRTTATEIRAAIVQHLVDPTTGALASSVEQLRAGDGQIADASVALILGSSTFEPGSTIGLATLDLLRARLFLSGTTARGYKRNDDRDLYDEREWVVIDLAMATALRSAGRVAQADALIDWITGQAAANFLLVPELLHQDDARYFGEVPMVGFGAGQYLLTLIDRSGTGTTPTPDAGVQVEDSGAQADASVIADASPMLDVGGPDAGVPVDAAVGADASTNDAAPRAGPVPRADDDCSCGTTSQPRRSTAAMLFIIVLVGLGRSNRRRAARA